MNKVYLGALAVLIIAFFIYGVHVENTYPHPPSGECQHCWVEHGMGTWEQIEHYNLMMSISLSSLGLFCVTTLIILYQEGYFKDE